MDNQHRQIKGYRELSPTEIALMNEAKQMGEQLGALLERVRNHLVAQRRAVTSPQVHGVSQELQDQLEAEYARLQAAEPERWIAMARTDLQTGVMRLVRAIAQPGSF